VIVDYLENAYPQKPLLPKDPLAAAKVRELMQFIDLHIELVARDLYAEAFFGGKVSDETKERVHKLLKRNVAALGKLAKFGPYIAGSEFTLADCSAAVNLPLAGMAYKAIFGEELFADYPVKEYTKLVGERPTMQRVNNDRKENVVLMNERRRAA